jgi:hypothetical protein
MDDMRIAFGYFDCLLDDEGRLSPTSCLASEERSPELAGVLQTIRGGLAVVEDDGTSDTVYGKFLERYQESSFQTLRNVLDHAYRANCDLAVLPGLTLSAAAIDIINRFSVAMTIVVVSPPDPAILKTVSDSLAEPHREFAAGRGHVVWIEGPLQRTAVRMERGFRPVQLPGEAQADISCRVDPGRGVSATLRLRLSSNNTFQVRFAGIGPSGGTLSMAAGSGQLVLARTYADKVQRIITLSIPDDAGLRTPDVHESLLVPESLDSALTSSAREIASDTTNQKTGRRLTAISENPVATELTRSLAAKLSLLENCAGDALGPVVVFLPHASYSAEESLYIALRDLRRDAEQRDVSDAGWLDAVGVRMRQLAPAVFPFLLDARDRPKAADDNYEWAFYGSLGAFDPAKAEASLQRQLDTLRVLADIGDTSIQVVYRLVTQVDRVTELPNTKFEIIVRYESLGDPNGDAERARRRTARSIGTLLHSVVGEAYSINYAEERPVLSYGPSPESTQRFRFTLIPDGHIAHWPDWGLLVSLAHEMGRDSSLEFVLRASASTSTSVADSLLDTVLRMDARDSQRFLDLGVSLEIMDGENDAFVALIQSQFSLHPSPVAQAATVTPVQAIRRFHPPFGELPARPGVKGPRLRLLVEPTTFPTSGLELGSVEVRLAKSDRSEVARIGSQDRLKHLYVVGKTGSGKTNLLKRLAEQDAATPGQGMTIIDPHGELVDHVLSAVPRSRVDQIVLLDFGRRDFMPVLNPFHRGMANVERDRTIQTLLRLMRERVYHEYTGPRFEEMVRMCLTTVMHPRYDGVPSLTRVPRLLIDRDYREAIVMSINDGHVTSQWAFHDSQSADRDYASTLDWAVSKFTDLVEDETLRMTLGGAERTVDYNYILESDGILLVKLPEAVIGPDAAEFLGALIVAQLRLAAFRLGPSRAVLGKPHFVYLDEFQKFTSTDIARVVTEARKFNLGFILAHQNLEQLREFSRYSGRPDDSLFAAVMGNVANTIVFRTGVLDSEILSRHLGLRDTSLGTLDRFAAAAHVSVAGSEVGPFTLSPPLVTTVHNPRNIRDVEHRMTRPEGVWRPCADLERRVSELDGVESVRETSPPGQPGGNVSFADEWLAMHADDDGSEG